MIFIGPVLGVTHVPMGCSLDNKFGVIEGRGLLRSENKVKANTSNKTSLITELRDLIIQSITLNVDNIVEKEVNTRIPLFEMTTEKYDDTNFKIVKYQNEIKHNNIMTIS